MQLCLSPYCLIVLTMPFKLKKILYRPIKSEFSYFSEENTSCSPNAFSLYLSEVLREFVPKVLKVVLYFLITIHSFYPFVHFNHLS